MSHLSMVIAFGTFVVAACPAKAANDFVVVVDISGSMNWSVKGLGHPVAAGNPARIDVVRASLLEFLGRLPENSRLYLISFHTGIVDEREFILRDAGVREGARRWVQALTPPGDSQTHLWTTFRKALQKMREYHDQSGGGWVTVRVLTDGENENSESSLSLSDVLKDFPEVDGKRLQPEFVLLGSFKVEAEKKVMAEMQASLSKKLVSVTRDPKMENPTPPVIVHEPAGPIMVGKPVTFFENSGKSYGSYTWTLDGQPIGSAVRVQRTFTKAGRSSLRLTVTKVDGGALPPAVMDVDVIVGAVRCDFAGPLQVDVGKATEYFDRSEGEIRGYRWLIDGVETSASRDLTHTFTKAARHQLTHVIVDPAGKEHPATKTVTAVAPPPPPPPKADFIASPAVAEVGQKILFAAISQEGVEEYRWDFGDGQMSDLKQVEHAYQVPGKYSVSLRVAGPGGANTVTKPDGVEVRAPLPLKAKFSWAPVDPRAGQKVRLIDESEGRPEVWLWRVEGVGELNEQSPEVVWAQKGEFQVTLAVRREGGEATSDPQKIRVRPSVEEENLVVVAFDGKPTRGRAPLRVEFRNRSKGVGARYRWEFGDGAGADTADAEHVYREAGRYHPRLTVTNVGGQASSNAKEVAIDVAAPPEPMAPWKKAVFLGVLAFLLWLLFAGLVLRPLRLPQQGVTAQTASTHNLRLLALRHGINWIWPRAFVTVGTRPRDDIRIKPPTGSSGGARATLAEIRRRPGTSAYGLRPRVADAVRRRVRQMTPEGGEKVSLAPVNPGRSHALADGDEFEIAGVKMIWHQPRVRKPPARRPPQAGKP